MLDLHTHSTASDGTLTPAQLVAEAERIGLSAVSLTDHDSVSGLRELAVAATGSKLEAVPGVEMAASWYGAHLHIVGLFVDSSEAELTSLLASVREARQVRNQRVVQRLNALGIEISWEDVTGAAGGETVGRPHIAHALVLSGACRDIRQAFAKFIGEGKPAYEQRHVSSPDRVIAAIHGAGGVAVWAHPTGLKRRGPAKMRQIARRLAGFGLDALEGYYSEYTPTQAAAVQSVAAELGLLLSGGSDFHGQHMPDIKLGVGRGGLCVPDSCLAPLASKAAQYQRRRKRVDACVV